jgi:hypothetical protein
LTHGIATLLLGVLEDEVAVGRGALTALGITGERSQQWLGAELQRLTETKRQAAPAERVSRPRGLADRAG